ncbi:MAG: hypothetical protein NTZ14_09045 [Hyphomicrobiales bacterium]|nr:hypothetical protein [Hyphomicrobiales bacterium]
MTDGYMNFIIYLWMVGAPMLGLLIGYARTPNGRSGPYTVI